jgi:toxin YxiD
VNLWQGNYGSAAMDVVAAGIGVFGDAGAAKLAMANAIHKANPQLRGLHLHEIHPVKFGGSPTDLANKVALTQAEHIPYRTWWGQLQRTLGQ